MKKVLFSIVIILLLQISVFGQYNFSGVIEGYSNRELNICSQFGEESELVETIVTGSGGNFSYQFVDSEVGLYRIYLENQSYFDIIFNNEDIHISTKPENPQYNMDVMKSEENAQLYSYLVENYIFDYKIDVIAQMLEIYPDGKFYNKVEKELQKEVKLKNKNIEKVIKSNPESFAGRYLKAFRVLPVSDKLNGADRIEYIESHYFDYYPMDDLEMINSNAYNEIVLNYFKIYKSNNQDIYYTAATKILDEIFFGEPKIFNFVFEYVLSGFESLSLDEAAAKISVDYGDLCIDGNESLKSRIKGNTALAIGEKAPDFSMKTVAGEDYTLSEMKTKYTLLIFWATWCSHCQVALPRLAAANNVFREADMDIVAVSIDSEKKILDSYLEENKLPWKLVCEYKGWEGDIIVDYAVFATPWMIIIDNNMKIVSKPYNEERLYDFLEEIITNK